MLTFKEAIKVLWDKKNLIWKRGQYTPPYTVETKDGRYYFFMDAPLVIFSMSGEQEAVYVFNTAAWLFIALPLAWRLKRHFLDYEK
jgi:hypothetical protein